MSLENSHDQEQLRKCFIFTSVISISIFIPSLVSPIYTYIHLTYITYIHYTLHTHFTHTHRHIYIYIYIHETQSSAQNSQKQDGRNVQVIIKTICHSGYHHNGFVVTRFDVHVLKCMSCRKMRLYTTKVSCYLQSSVTRKKTIH